MLPTPVAIAVSSAAALAMATSANARALAAHRPTQSLPRQTRRGAGGSLADLLLVEGNPLKDVDLIADPERSFVVIMKDGVVVKNSIPQ